jgi:hypothetical protein
MKMSGEVYKHFNQDTYIQIIQETTKTVNQGLWFTVDNELKDKYFKQLTSSHR